MFNEKFDNAYNLAKEAELKVIAAKRSLKDGDFRKRLSLIQNALADLQVDLFDKIYEEEDE